MDKHPSSAAGAEPSDSAAFYVMGGTLHSTAACYLTRQADQHLFDGLCQGHFCYVPTARQVGKSSLMVRAAGRLRAADCATVILDLTALDQNLTAEQWYDGLLSRVGLQLN